MKKTKILVGTTNQSKMKRFQKILNKLDVKCCTLSDLNINSEPDETGKTPAENAAIKAEFYGQYNDLVICNDSGLYFSELELDDQRQPALHVRSPLGQRLDDEGMIKYYTNLIKELGGKVEAYYLDGFAVYNRGKVSTFMNIEYSKKNSFYMVDIPSDKRRIGWPLDSISKTKSDNIYFVDMIDNDEVIIVNEYEQKLQEFLIKKLGIEVL